MLTVKKNLEKAKGQKDLLTFAELKQKELNFIKTRNSKVRKPHKSSSNLTALCLSGGGIRSAAFCLGVIRTLAELGVLKKFDYLSTVSGGGYIGSLITRWVYEHNDGYEGVEALLKNCNGHKKELLPLFHLRRYCSYLTPKLGLFSLDSLTGVALYLRNLILNWLVFVPFCVLAVVLVKILNDLNLTKALQTGWISALLFSIAFALIGWSYAESLRSRPGWKSQGSVPVSKIILIYGFYFFAAALILVLIFNKSPLNANWSFVVGSGGLLCLISFLHAVFLYYEPSNRPKLGQGFWLIGSGIAMVIQGACVAGILYCLSNFSVEFGPELLLIFGPLAFVISNFIGETIYAGITSRAPKGDSEREWLARSAGAQFRLPILWTLFTLSIFLGSSIYKYFPTDFTWKYWGTIVPAGTAITGFISIWLGKARTTAAFVKDSIESTTEISARWIIAISMPLFLIGATAIISCAVDLVVSRIFPGDGLERIPYLSLIGFIGLMIGIFSSYLVNINKFSLHSIYRNRLVRTFLGGCNPNRTPDSLTDFDSSDDISLCALRVPKVKRATNNGPTQPQLHLLNMTMNILSSPELIWQERKALPFSASMIAVGCLMLRNKTIDKNERADGCYRDAKDYAKGTGSRAFTLGTAMAISGAAVNSNMGYHSSPSLNVLMTLANVRLGAWFGNPKPTNTSSLPTSTSSFHNTLRWIRQKFPSSNHATFTDNGPAFAFEPLAREALGFTSEEDNYVQLSDGGHFDNLGLYEVLARKCQKIVVVDAGADSKIELFDLSRVIRMARLDLNAIVVFNARDIAKIKDGKAAFAIAKIKYDTGARGKLLYIKPMVLVDAPVTIHSYKALNHDFPNEPTRDQWFTETKLDVYSELGSHISSLARKEILEMKL